MRERGYNAPSQRHHDCILISLKDRIEILFDELIIIANEEDINETAPGADTEILMTV